MQRRLPPYSILAMVLLPAGGGLSASADVLLDQPHDFINGLASEIGTIVSEYRTADDFASDRPFIIERLTFWMIVTFPDSPGDYGFELYDEAPDGVPADDPFLNIVGPSTVKDLGIWTHFQQFHLFEITYDDLEIALDAGHYWLVSLGYGNGQFNDRAFWGTSGEGDINWMQGHSCCSMGFPRWRPVSDVLGYPTDFAMRIEGVIIPAPPAIAAILLPFARFRRRRAAPGALAPPL